MEANPGFVRTDSLEIFLMKGIALIWPGLSNELIEISQTQNEWVKYTGSSLRLLVRLVIIIPRQVGDQRSHLKRHFVLG